MSQSVPGYGIAFRIDDYIKRPSIQPSLPPMKTQRRQQQDVDVRCNQTQPPATHKPMPQLQHIQQLQEQYSETKLTASDMAVLIQRRLPADKLYKLESNQTLNPCQKQAHEQPDLIINNEPKKDLASAINEVGSTCANTTNVCKNNTALTGIKYICGCICGCTVCTTTVGLIIALCYECFS